MQPMMAWLSPVVAFDPKCCAQHFGSHVALARMLR